MSHLTRCEVLRAGAADGVAVGVSALAYDSLIARALAAAKPCAGTLNDIEHFVIIGLGFCVPMLIVSPLSRGGFVG